MKTDALNRRLRFAGRQPTGTAIRLQPRDLLYFAAINRHGPLPTHFLYQFTKHLGRNYNKHQRRLKELFNEDNTPHRGAYLERPWQQRQTIDALQNAEVHEITPFAVQALAEQGSLSRHSAPAGGHNSPYLHRFMTASVTASIELAVRKAGLRYICQEEILTHKACPERTKLAKTPIAMPLSFGGTLIPDQLFGIEYPEREGKRWYRFFALEADRQTESIDPRKDCSNSIARKFKAYLDIKRNATYRSHLGILNLTVLTVTTSPLRIQTMIETLQRLTEHEPKSRGGFLFKAKPEFGLWFRTPPVMLDLLTQPWQRTGGALDTSNISGSA